MELISIRFCSKLEKAMEIMEGIITFHRDDKVELEYDKDRDMYIVSWYSHDRNK